MCRVQVGFVTLTCVCTLTVDVSCPRVGSASSERGREPHGAVVQASHCTAGSWMSSAFEQLCDPGWTDEQGALRQPRVMASPAGVALDATIADRVNRDCSQILPMLLPFGGDWLARFLL